MKITISFAWYDIWVGVYIDRKNRAVYICPLPMLLIKVWQAHKPVPEPEIRYTIINTPEPTSEPKFAIGDKVRLPKRSANATDVIKSVHPSRDAFRFFGWAYHLELRSVFLVSEEELEKVE
jgi:hypothetical protein